MLPARTTAKGALLGDGILRLVLQTADIAVEERVHLRPAQNPGVLPGKPFPSETGSKPSFGAPEGRGA